MKCQITLAVTIFFVSASHAQVGSLSAADRQEIQDLVAEYAVALFGCDAEGFADLFVAETGYFASGFRGMMTGRGKLIELVESERHCLAPAGSAEATRAGGTNAPAVELQATDGRVFGIADLGTAEYQDEYAKTADGWRFASRTVIIATEKAAGLDADDLLAIQRLGGDELGDYYATDVGDEPRLLSSGIAITVEDGEVKGRAYLKDGGYRDEVYEQLETGNWRVRSRVLTPP